MPANDDGDSVIVETILARCVPVPRAAIAQAVVEARAEALSATRRAARNDDAAADDVTRRRARSILRGGA